MELNINRLKILGEEEIEKLDNKIKEYRDKTSILNKSIPDIKCQLDDLTFICEDEQSNYDAKMSEYNKLLKKLNYRKNKIDNIKLKIQNINSSINDIIIDICKKEELINKLNLEKKEIFIKNDEIIKKEKELNDTVNDISSKLSIEKNNLELLIKSFELNIKNMANKSLKQQTEFIQTINNIKIDTEINNSKNIFDSIKHNLIEIMCKNIIYYEKNKLCCLLGQKNNKPIIYRFDNIKKANTIDYNVTKEMHDIHNRSNLLVKDYNINKYNTDQYKESYKINIDIHKFISDKNHSFYNSHKDINNYKKKNIDIYFRDTCNICHFIGERIEYIYYPCRSHTSEVAQFINELKNYNIKCIKWLEDNYSKILNKIITHPELLILINKLNFKEIYDLFKSYEPFNINDMDSYEFICLIAFIGTNGYNIDNMKLIEIE
jgi:DNA repair exonuclease SbcCD ATPase subunit